MTITPADVQRVSAAWRSAGELFEVHGVTMLNLADDWQAGARAANLDPSSRQNRWSNCGPGDTEGCGDCPHATPNDPTGEAAIAAKRDEFAAELQHRAQRMHADALWLRDAAHLMAPVVPPSSMNDPASDLWCAHHLRVGICEIRHRNDLCRFCDDFLKLWKARPPMSVIRDRHDGKRITEKLVKAALEAEGHRLEEVNGVTKAIAQARPQPRKPNQNQKRKAG